jgi:hypothetical protein
MKSAYFTSALSLDEIARRIAVIPGFHQLGGCHASDMRGDYYTFGYGSEGREFTVHDYRTSVCAQENRARSSTPVTLGFGIEVKRQDEQQILACLYEVLEALVTPDPTEM